MLLDILLGLAPQLIGAVIGGKAGEVVHAGARVAREVLGTDDPKVISQKLSDPAVMEAFKLRLAQETEHLQATLADVQDARHQMVALTQTGSPMAWGAAIVSTLVVIGFLFLTGALLFRQIPDNNITMVLFGALSAGFTQVLNYWLGSSHGSKSKDDLLAALAKPPSAVEQLTKAIAGRSHPFRQSTE